MHFKRCASGLIAIVAIFIALRKLPLATVVSISFAAPIFTTVLSIFLLKEKVGLYRWLAVGVGLVGIIVISEPGVSSVERKVMALDMSRLENKKNRAMSELQDVIKEIESLDNTLALLKDLEAISKKSKGDIYDIPIDDLTDEVKEYAASKAQKRRISEEIDRKLWQIAREKNFADKLEINSYPAYIMRLRGKYRIIVLIKIKEENDLLHNLVENLGKEYIIDPNIKIDIDPIQIT